LVERINGNNKKGDYDQLLSRVRQGWDDSDLAQMNTRRTDDSMVFQTNKRANDVKQAADDSEQKRQDAEQKRQAYEQKQELDEPGEQRGRPQGRGRGRGRGGIPIVAAQAANIPLPIDEEEKQHQLPAEEADTKYKGYCDVSPFKILDYYDCMGSIILDGMHSISNIVQLVVALISGKQLRKFESKSIPSRLAPDIIQILSNRKAEQVALLETFQLKAGCEPKDIADRYNNLKGPSDFIESGNGPFHNYSKLKDKNIGLFLCLYNNNC
jgi:hypothetical protein